MTAPPDAAKVEQLSWSKEFYRSETIELQGFPWYKNYRILSAILVVVTIGLVITFW